MSAEQLRPGGVIDDRFVLKSSLGGGSIGAVWLASDQKSGGKEIALKILHAQLSRESLIVERFARESTLLTRLDHPNIAKPILFRSTGELTYLAMERVEGRPLDREMGERTTARRPYDPGELTQIFGALCDALSYAHSQSIVHRDIKPQNIMIHHEAAQSAIKVLDFGIAKLLEGGGGVETTLGRRTGFLFYMSPEQTVGRPADARSDVFALTTVLFELVTLHRAWAWDAKGHCLPAFDQPLQFSDMNSMVTVLARIAAGPRPVASTARSGLPRTMDLLLERGMAIAPDERPQTVAELRDLALTEIRLLQDVSDWSDDQTTSSDDADTALMVVDRGAAIPPTATLSDNRKTLSKTVTLPEQTSPLARRPRFGTDAKLLSSLAVLTIIVFLAGVFWASPKKPTTVQLPSPSPAVEPTPTPSYGRLRALAQRARAHPADQAPLRELRDAIIGAASALPDAQERQSIERVASLSTIVGNIEGLESCIRRLERASTR